MPLLARRVAISLKPAVDQRVMLTQLPVPGATPASA